MIANLGGHARLGGACILGMNLAFRQYLIEVCTHGHNVTRSHTDKQECGCPRLIDVGLRLERNATLTKKQKKHVFELYCIAHGPTQIP